MCANAGSGLGDPVSGARLVLAGVLAVGLARCTSSAGTSRSSLASLPEAHLFYPQSVVIERLGHGDGNGPDGPVRASEGWLLGTAADRASVEGFYRDQLQQLGWQPDTADVFQGTGETEAIGWRKGVILFRFAIPTKGDVRTPRAADSYTTAYRIDLSHVG